MIYLEIEIKSLMKALEDVEKNKNQDSMEALKNATLVIAAANNDDIDKTKENTVTRETIDKELLKIQSKYPKFSKESKALGKAIRINLPIKERMKSRFVATKIEKNISSATNRILSMMPFRNKKNQSQGRH